LKGHEIESSLKFHRIRVFGNESVNETSVFSFFFFLFSFATVIKATNISPDIRLVITLKDAFSKNIVDADEDPNPEEHNQLCLQSAKKWLGKFCLAGWPFCVAGQVEKFLTRYSVLKVIFSFLEEKKIEVNRDSNKQPNKQKIKEGVEALEEQEFQDDDIEVQEHDDPSLEEWNDSVKHLSYKYSKRFGLIVGPIETIAVVKPIHFRFESRLFANGP